EVARAVAEVGIGGQQVDREWVMNAGLNAAGIEGGYKVIAVISQDGIDMIDMAVAGEFGWQRDAAAGKEAPVGGGVSAAGLGPLFEVAQLDAEHGALDAFHAVVVALEDVLVFLFGSPITEHANGADVVGMIRGYQAAF